MLLFSVSTLAFGLGGFEALAPFSLKIDWLCKAVPGFFCCLLGGLAGSDVLGVLGGNVDVGKGVSTILSEGKGVNAAPVAAPMATRVLTIPLLAKAAPPAVAAVALMPNTNPIVFTAPRMAGVAAPQL